MQCQVILGADFSHTIIKLTRRVKEADVGGVVMSLTVYVIKCTGDIDCTVGYNGRKDL